MWDRTDVLQRYTECNQKGKEYYQTIFCIKLNWIVHIITSDYDSYYESWKWVSLTQRKFIMKMYIQLTSPWKTMYVNKPNDRYQLDNLSKLWQKVIRTKLCIFLFGISKVLSMISFCLGWRNGDGNTDKYRRMEICHHGDYGFYKNQ
jgi:hypothetical protein